METFDHIACHRKFARDPLLNYIMWYTEEAKGSCTRCSQQIFVLILCLYVSMRMCICTVHLALQTVGQVVKSEEAAVEAAKAGCFCVFDVRGSQLMPGSTGKTWRWLQCAGMDFHGSRLLLAHVQHNLRTTRYVDHDESSEAEDTPQEKKEEVLLEL